MIYAFLQGIMGCPPFSLPPPHPTPVNSAEIKTNDAARRERGGGRRGGTKAVLGRGGGGGGTHPPPGHPPPLGGRRGGAARLSLTGPLRTTCAGGGSAIGPRHVSRNPGRRRHRRGPVKTGGQQAGPRVAGRGGGGSGLRAGTAAVTLGHSASARLRADNGRTAPGPTRAPPALG